jgi:hypothetical protein
MYLHGVPDVLSVHATLAGCERAQRAAQAQANGERLLYICSTVSIAP